MMLLNSPMTYQKTMGWIKRSRLWQTKETDAKRKQQILLRFVIIIFSPIISPIVVVMSMLELMWIKFKIGTETKKNKKAEFQQIFWNLQIDFGMFETVEAAEATSQLLLQVWMLASKYDLLYERGRMQCIQDAVIGLFQIFLFTPSVTCEHEIQKTLGKFLLAFLSIIFSALSMYQRTKREAVQFTSSIFLTISIISQIVVHLACLLPFYTIKMQPTWCSLVFPLVIHYLLIFILKLILDPSWKLANVGKFQKCVMLVLNVVGSIIINVNVVSSNGYCVDYTSKLQEQSTDGDESESSLINDALVEKGQPSGKQPQPNTNISLTSKKITTHHNPSTFLLQSTYFLIKLIENILVILALIVHYKIQNLTTEGGEERMFSSFPLKIGLTVGVGTLISWVSHVIYYRLHGHLWKSANGPTINVEKSLCSFKYEYYLCGKRKESDFFTSVEYCRRKIFGERK